MTADQIVLKMARDRSDPSNLYFNGHYYCVAGKLPSKSINALVKLGYKIKFHEEEFESDGMVLRGGNCPAYTSIEHPDWPKPEPFSCYDPKVVPKHDFKMPLGILL